MQAEVFIGEGDVIYILGHGVLRKVTDNKWEFKPEKINGLRKLDDPLKIENFFNEEEKRFKTNGNGSSNNP
ncbi:MAG: hypothetical protein WCV59_03690 [Parcubacteria group bacterium]|jgi:hypothetical protein